MSIPVSVVRGGRSAEGLDGGAVIHVLSVLAQKDPSSVAPRRHDSDDDDDDERVT